ncbi:MAG: hypothetical protein HMLIMOIP_002099 [Candidatus Nitrosomirales archaeon]
MITHTRTHVQIGFANPFLVCEECRNRVPYWHDPGRCGCDEISFNYPCEHAANVVSICPTWSPVEGCSCEILCVQPN